MRIRLSVNDQDGFSRDVALEVPAGATLRDVSDDIMCVLSRYVDNPAPDMWSGTRRLPASAMLGGRGLRNGDTITLGGAGERDLIAGSVLRLQVIGGPDAGTIVSLPRGVLTVGRAPACDLRLTDPDVSRQHAAITVTAAGVSVRDLGSTNGTQLDGSPVDADGSTVLPGQLLRLGDSLLCIAGADEPAAATRPADDGTLLVNRPPRLPELLPEHEVTFPVRIPLTAPQRMQWFAALIPAVAGCVLALSMHNLDFLAFALLSPAMILGTAAGDRLHWRSDRRREAVTHRRREAIAVQKRDRLLAVEIAHRRRAHPDPAALLRTATIPDCRLWERRRRHLDLLEVRLGLGDQAAYLRIRRGSEVASAGTASLVPMPVSLRNGPLGIAGPRAVIGGTARWIAAQLAVLHSPSDLEQILVLSDDAAGAWTWARWLPHVDGKVACTAEARAAVLTDLRRLVDERLEESRTSSSAWTGPWLVLVIDRAGELAELPGLAQILADGPHVGVTAVCVDDDERRLPAACAAVARVQGETGTRLGIAVAGSTATCEVINDRVSTKWAERVARALAALTDGRTDGASTLPAGCRLIDLLGVDGLTPEAVAARWQPGGTPRTEIGVTATGAFSIDLVRDGPHLLIAGTTGSGKSELLQSLIAGLSVHNPPEAIAFVLIDYKGGAAFADCARLPHCAGLVTDLDPHLTQRALRSLDAELQRRETLFARAGAHDLDSYRRGAQHATEPLGRLVLIVDEFAALSEELPDFVSGLVGIAQRGRSLGVHLVLATQRPGGVVSPEIRANTTLRVALRVTDPAESSDVIGAAVAASIDKHRPGRAYIRAGAALTEIQTARVSGPVAPAREVSVTALDQWGRLPIGIEPPAEGKTDLQLLVGALCEAAAQTGAPRPRRPWLPPLPQLLRSSDLGAPGATAIPLGMIDLPNQQRQEVLTVDLGMGGAMLFAGSARSGRSTVLRSLAINSSQRLSSNDMHLYVIDCAGGSLRPLGELPHCGAVATRDEFHTVHRVLRWLADEIGKRQAALAKHRLSSIGEARAQGIPIPILLLVLDGWDSFVAAADDEDVGSSVETLLGLLRESAAAGLTVAVSGDRSTLAARLASVVPQKYVLRLADRADYALAGIPLRAVPAVMPAGRAICVQTGQEVQLAFTGQAPSAAEDGRIIAEVAQAARPSSPGCEPFHIRALPGRVRLSDLRPQTRKRWMVLGSGGDAADTVAVDLYAGDARLLVVGPPKSGRTNALHLLMEQARRIDVEVIVAAPRRSPLRQAAASCRIAVATPEDCEIPCWQSSGHRLLLVDDSEAFIDTVVGDALSALVRSDLAGLAAAVAARNDELAVTYRGVAYEARRSRTGLLLQPGPGDGDLLGVRLPRRRSAPIPGRGILVLDACQLGDVGGGFGPLPIQVALPSAAHGLPRSA